LRTTQTLLIRGGTSSVGMAATTLAKARGVTVIATTRQEANRARLIENGADHVVVDDGHVARAVRGIVPGGADALLELVGPSHISDSFAALRPGARACLTGFLGADWDDSKAVAEASRLGIELKRFGSNVITAETFGDIFQTIVDGIEQGRFNLNLDRAFPLAEIADAHRYMEANRATGKVVVTT
jgi:NADPH:quinone reductase-like Zn-dependent oxidoreductase